ncbi:MAG: hypothetical protein FWG87_05530 [Defluviitaleaceae bacterium]|nr:hypothetical protein [Defluviitaleaceae bacterium]
MYSDVQTSAIMSAGMKALSDTLGAIETEIFITTIGRNTFDYTKWRENLWEDLTARELFERSGKGYKPPDRVVVV